MVQTTIGIEWEYSEDGWLHSEQYQDIQTGEV